MEENESIDHLCLHCTVAKSVWDMFCDLFGMSWVMKLKDMYNDTALHEFEHLEGEESAWL